MVWLIFVIVLGVIVIARIRAEQRAGRWSWSKFFFSLGFGALECVIITFPLLVMNMNSRYFWPVYGASWVVAILLFVKFILIARKWKFPDTRTLPQADQNDRNQPPPR